MICEKIENNPNTCNKTKQKKHGRFARPFSIYKGYDSDQQTGYSRN
jgi:hypothetical protein